MSQMPSPVSREEKLGALERVLQSRALGRSEQLRAFLRYVCDAELQGRAHDLNEYALGVQALGRPEGYSPAEDSCVRSRAYELRNKLRHFYEIEAPNEPIRIEIAKGGYVPRFNRASSSDFAQRAEPGALETQLKRWSAGVRAIWEPFVVSDAPLLISFEVRLFWFSPSTGLVLRDRSCNDAAGVSRSQALTQFQQSTGETELRETRDYADFGAVHAAFLLGRLLASSRRPVGLKHAESLDWQDVFNCNLVFIGKPNSQPIIQSMLADMDLVDDLGTIRIKQPKEGEATEYRSEMSQGFAEKYALITRLRGPQSGRHMLLLCGAGAEFMWGLAESVTNAEHASDLMNHIRLPSGEYPENYQVLLRMTFQQNVPVRIQYVTHRVLSR